MNTFTHPRRRRNLAALVIAVTVAVGIAAGAVATADGSATSQAQKPTIVLVHGAWADSSGWNDSIEKLQKKGYTALAVANPLRSLHGDAAYLRSVLASISGPIVLVGHSYGGMVLTNAATGNPNVKALVYIAAFAPDKGETQIELILKNPGSQISPATLTVRPYPGGLDSYITPSLFRQIFAQDVSEKTAAIMAATQRPFDLAILEEVSGEPAWKKIPSWYLVTSEDRAIPPATQRFMANRAGAQTTEVEASHVPQISRPGAATRIILEAAESLD